MSFISDLKGIYWKQMFIAAAVATAVKIVVGLIVLNVFGWGKVPWFNGAALRPDGTETEQLIAGLAFVIVVSIVFYGTLYAGFMHHLRGRGLFLRTFFLGTSMALISVLVMPWNKPLEYDGTLARTIGMFAYCLVMGLMYRHGYEDR